MHLKYAGVIALLFSILQSSTWIVPGKGSPEVEVSAFSAGIDGFCFEIFSMLRSNVSKPDYNVFREALTGFLNLKASNRISKNMLTIIDYSLSSKLERMWIIDLNTMEIVKRSLVAHGRNSGDEFAYSFSNSPASLKSSLGFYLTGGTYKGNKGLTLLLDGVEAGINDKAREREIVMHGAWYVSSDFIRQYGRLGRSFGCPAIPFGDHKKVMELLAGGSCMFIYYPDLDYHRSTKMLGNAFTLEGMYRLYQHYLQFISFMPEKITLSR